jgi:hypothetical protein
MIILACAAVGCKAQQAARVFWQNQGSYGVDLPAALSAMCYCSCRCYFRPPSVPLNELSVETVTETVSVTVTAGAAAGCKAQQAAQVGDIQ